jgi:hypothetical protein
VVTDSLSQLTMVSFYYADQSAWGEQTRDLAALCSLVINPNLDHFKECSDNRYSQEILTGRAE